MMDSFAPICSIVIRAFNEEKHIKRLLSGIQMQDYSKREIILVDSGSTDKTIDIANEFGAKIVNISPTDFTFGRSLNKGIAAASGEIVVIISAHCYPVYPDWLNQLLAPFSDGQVAVSYGKQRGAKSNHFSEHQFFRNYFPDISQPNQGQPFTHNANAAIRKSLWMEHAYNENLTGLEDLEWSSWAKQSGYRIAYVSEAEIIHIHEETFNQVHNRYKREAIAMKQILPNSRFTLKNMVGMTLRKVIEDLTQARRENVIQNEIWNIIRFRTMQYLGTWQGYRYSGNIDQGLHRRFYYPPDTLLEKIPESRLVKPIEYQSETKLEH